MIVSLKPYPGAAVPAIEIRVDVARSRERLALQYVISGDVGAVAWPEPVRPMRQDRLWERTCCEAFVRPGAGEGYTEFNFCPSGLWAAYAFARPRSGMRPIDAEPVSQVERGEGRLLLSTEVALDSSFETENWALNITTVIQDTDGNNSFWALKHPLGAPDFHNPDCFVLQLPAAD
jgi:hypothetical protein